MDDVSISNPLSHIDDVSAPPCTPSRVQGLDGNIHVLSQEPNPVDLLRQRRAKIKADQDAAAGGGGGGGEPDVRTENPITNAAANVAAQNPSAAQTKVEAKTAAVSNFGRFFVFGVAFLIVIVIAVYKINEEAAPPVAGSCEHMPDLKNIKRNAISCPGNEIGVRLIIVTDTWANEYTIRVDKGAILGKSPKLKDHTTYVDEFCLTQDKHKLSYFDQYGDGWHCGFWALEDSSGQKLIAGGPTNGRVTGDGGETEFTPGGTVTVSQEIVVPILPACCPCICLLCSAALLLCCFAA